MIRNIKIYVVFLLLLVSINGCGTAKRFIRLNDNNLFGGVLASNNTFLITDTLNLKGKNLVIPQDVTLIVKKGGFIRNGRITGNFTRIQTNETVFGNVEIAGTWNIPVISTSMFSNLNADNSLKNVLALTNNSVKNKVIIEKGNYYVRALRNADVCLKVTNNTSVELRGNVIMRENAYPNYSVITLEGNNIEVLGGGCIIGDRDNHLRENGEWGMCLTIKGSSIAVTGISISKAWGDCIYITGKSKEVKITNCILDRGRRQGISIISADNVFINNCIINNIEGTAPEYAIDVEPNQRDTVTNVIIEKVKVNKCKGGFSANGRAKESYVYNITLKNCNFEAEGRPVVIGTTIKRIKVSGCIIKQTEGEKLVAFDHVSDLIIRNNEGYSKEGKVQKKLRVIKKIVGINTWPLLLEECERIDVKNNVGLQ